MGLVYELTIQGTAEQAKAAQDWFDTGLKAILTGAPGLVCVDLYVPAPDRPVDPYVNDGLGPLLIAIPEFKDMAALKAALSAAKPALAALPAGLKASGIAMERQFIPVAGETQAAPLKAQISYIVRYHGPSPDPKGFVAHYIDSHGSMLGEFPRIRNVICLVPQPWTDPNGLIDPNYVLGNEVAFDSSADFAEAMKSDVRHRLREDWKKFPRFDGANTHFLMARTRLAG